jgi:hypothetical protein
VERPRRSSKVLRLGVATLVYLAASALSARWHGTWGSNPAERAASLPGDQLVPLPAVQTTRAITIEAPPARVWPWLVQMGQGRGGLYTYEWIENAIGADIHNADRIVPGLQRLQAGDRIRLTPDPYLGRVPGQYYEVEDILPQQALVLRQQPPGGGSNSWSFVLASLDRDRTRLIVRGRRSAPAGVGARIAQAAELLALGPGYFVMERGMLLGIKRRAEATEGCGDGQG